MKKKKRKKLKFTQLFIPSIAIICSFVIAYIGVNISINSYINEETSKKINNIFSLLDLNYKNSEIWEKDIEEDDSNLPIPTGYMIFDNNNINIDKNALATKKEKMINDNITKYIKNNNELVKNNQKNIIKMKKQVYHILVKKYYGYYDGYMLFEKERTEKNNEYNVLVYSDVTAIYSFVEFFNKILILFLLLSSLIAIVIITKSTYEVSVSFSKLKKHIKMIGKEEVPQNLNVPYQEFDEVIVNINEMSRKIKTAENNQKSFFQNASHELRTPLMSIQGYAEAIKEGVYDTDKSVNIILKETERMARLINEILFLSKMETKNTKMNFEKTNVKELLYSCAWSIKSEASKKDILINFNIDEDDIYACVDENMIERAFLNIMSNALRYAKKNIGIYLIKAEKYLVIGIIDDGEGISEEEMPKIFNRFYKGDKGNFGIGLAITKEIIEAHNGVIEVKSKEDFCEFIVKIPISR